MPCPAIPVSDCLRIRSQQMFDVIALVETITECSSGGCLSRSGQQRVRFTVTLTDGSKLDSVEKPELAPSVVGVGECMGMPLTIFVNATHSGGSPPLYDLLRAAKDNRTVTPTRRSNGA